MVCIAARVSDISVPAGCSRLVFNDTTYAGWIQGLPIRNDKRIQRYDGSYMPEGYYNVMAVIDLPMLFRDDIEQCADWCFRFWSHYHRGRNRLGSWYLLDYNGQRRYFSKSGRSFNGFLKWAMNNANSHSIKSGCMSVDTSDIQPGDMLVQNLNGGIGHVSVVMDVCRDPKGAKFYILGYSFMPAQQFHIERAGEEYGSGGWFTLDGYYRYLERNINFGPPVIKRFTK